MRLAARSVTVTGSVIIASGWFPDRQTCGRMEFILMQDKREGAEFKAA